MSKKETFGSGNQTKVIGSSMYRICNTDIEHGYGKWFIRETYNDGKAYAQKNGYFRNNLEDVIDIFNVIEKERFIIDYYKRGYIDPPMSVHQ